MTLKFDQSVGDAIVTVLKGKGPLSPQALRQAVASVTPKAFDDTFWVMIDRGQLVRGKDFTIEVPGAK